MKQEESAILVLDKKERSHRLPVNSNPFSHVIDEQADNCEKEELGQLAKTAGAKPLACIRFDFSRPSANLFIGKGQAEKLNQLCREKNASLIIFDCELSPVQQRNLEEITQVKVINRTQLILDIFALHAKSKEGELQVELAQVNYMLTRLTGKGVELSRLGGGIGTRGPGEMKLEYDKRIIRKHTTLLKKKLGKIALHRELKREKRKENMVPLIVLVGYTNSGKTTLINNLAAADFEQGNKLFLTLDSVMRKIEVGENQKAVIVDTVGFIQGLPHQLIESFKSTLEEVNYADILVHVIDASSQDIEKKNKVVIDIINELDASDKPVITVLNKEDMLDNEKKDEVKALFSNGIFISASKGSNIEQLKAEISRILKTKRIIAKFLIPFDKMNIVSAIHEQGRIISKKFTENAVKIEAEIPRVLSAKLEQYKIR
jgi:GTP-binding protein HflX